MTSVQLRRHCFRQHQTTSPTNSIVYEILRVTIVHLLRSPSPISCTELFALDIQALLELEHHRGFAHTG